MNEWNKLIRDFYELNKDDLSNHKLATAFLEKHPRCSLAKDTLRKLYFGKLRRQQLDQHNNDYTQRTSVDTKGDEQIIDHRGPTPITTEEQAIEFFQIDIDKWEIERLVHNVWDTSARVREQDLQWEDGVMSGRAKRTNEWTKSQNYQCKVWLVRRKQQRVEVVEERLEKLFEKLAKQSPSHEVLFDHPKESNKAAILNLFDAHIDKLVLSSETYSNSSIADNINRFESSFDELLEQIRFYNPRITYFPVGNDFWTTNGPENTTKKGTPQQISTTSEESFDMGFEVIVRCIEKLMRIGRVVVPVIKGNHDEDKTYYLGHSLDAYYHKNPNVLIDRSRHQRKYYRFGVNMFGFAHGDKEKRKLERIPLYMAEEKKEMWAQTLFRTFFLGDIHHANRYKLHLSHDGVGVEVKFLRALTDQDKWHTDEGWIGILKTAYAEIWDYDEGRKAGFEVTFK